MKLIIANLFVATVFTMSTAHAEVEDMQSPPVDNSSNATTEPTTQSAQPSVVAAPVQSEKISDSANTSIASATQYEQNTQDVDKVRIIAHHQNWKFISSKKGRFITGIEDNPLDGTAYIALEKRKNGKFSVSICSNHEIEAEKNASITVNNKSFVLFNGDNNHCATSYDKEQDEAIISNMLASSATLEPTATLSFLTVDSQAVEVSIPLRSFKRVYDIAKRIS
ncbi:hypothetical protein Fsol_00497 [Candidatus Fokinia solitaria]|uniref:Invasion associated locus B family protein n=1 Tax=Candidatus Fokinia solitaria TaxID=1802984 RepID=A0A2U8BSH6_9RICK|nr:hypothetical protein [Candidatus Fokinia solitaria]AWD33291.1 hypothetical protein Fsol_00497 [Candidatus Fokinia solitaria]